MAAVSRAVRRPVPFWLRPKWVVGHVLVVVLTVTFVALGLWQLDRLQERRARNADISARAELAIEPIDDVVPAGAALDDVEELRYRRVSLTGSYDPAGQVLIRPRSLDGVSGWHVVTPVVLDEGRAVLVTRGFAPLSTDLESSDGPSHPRGRGDRHRPRLPHTGAPGHRPHRPDEGVLAELSRVDIARIGQQYDRTLLPVHVQLESQEPPQAADLPAAHPDPVTDEGPHLSYAVQWFLFAGVGLVGWPILLHRTGREERDGGGAGRRGGRRAPAAGGGGRATRQAAAAGRAGRRRAGRRRAGRRWRL
jgi:cytochrome oxidase assembly protein ShyY1